MTPEQETLAREMLDLFVRKVAVKKSTHLVEAGLVVLRPLSEEEEQCALDGKINTYVFSNVGSFEPIPSDTGKLVLALAEKLEAQKQIKTLEAKRNNKRRQLFEAQDDVDRKRAELIEEIERQLQTKTSIEPVFTLRWTLRDGAGTTA